MDPAVIFSAMTAAVAALFGMLAKERNDRLNEAKQSITDMKKERDDARAELRDAQNIMAKNTDALTKIAPALEVLVEVQRHSQSRSTATVIDPLPEGR